VTAAHRVLSSDEKRQHYLSFLLLKSELSGARSPGIVLEAEVAMKRGERALRARRNAEAVSALHEAVERNPREPEYLAMLAFAELHDPVLPATARAAEARAAAPRPRWKLDSGHLRAMVVLALAEDLAGDRTAARRRHRRGAAGPPVQRAGAHGPTSACSGPPGLATLAGPRRQALGGQGPSSPGRPARLTKSRAGAQRRDAQEGEGAALQGRLPGQDVHVVEGLQVARTRRRWAPPPPPAPWRGRPGTPPCPAEPLGRADATLVGDLPGAHAGPPRRLARGVLHVDRVGVAGAHLAHGQAVGAEDHQHPIAQRRVHLGERLGQGARRGVEVAS